MRTALLPGSFDPITNGHVDIIKQAANLFDRVIVLIMTNSTKHYLFSVDERMEFVQDAVGTIANVRILKKPAELTINAAQELNATAIVRGVRNSTDFLYEQQIATMNKMLAPNIETILLFTKPQESFVASSLIKEVARFGGDVTAFLPNKAAKALKEKMKNIDEL
jgi:pantetheine-phosphate adenylyltransferase